jgi:uncharacterized protein YjiS (DUF1127 family)
MTTLELRDFADERPNTNGALGGIRRVLASVKDWYVRRQTLARLSQLSDRQLIDVGFDPSQVYDAVNGQHASLWEKPHNRPDLR